jgi:FADH2-dependent halogenase
VRGIHRAFQVERSKFDDLLLRHAAKWGADVREGVTVEHVAADAEGVTVAARDEAGAVTEHRARFLVDASGRGNFTGNQEGIKVPNAKLKKLAVFGHFENVGLDPGTPAGDTVIVRLDKKWFWLIPLRLADAGQAQRQGERGPGDGPRPSWPPRSVRLRPSSNTSWTTTPRSRRGCAGPNWYRPCTSRSDFSYRNRTFWSPRVVRVGDAAGFIDPIFSSGVFIAMFSAKLASEAILELLERGGDGSDRFPAYERRINAAMRIYWEMVENFYTTPFMEVLMEPRPKWDIAAAINAILAGELEGGWRLRWRMRAFFWLVRITARWPFMPKLDFPRISGGTLS